MSRVGVIGLGKVGLPLALTLARHGGHDVVGFDVDRDRVFLRLADISDHGESLLGGLIGDPETRQRFLLAHSVDALVSRSDVVLLCVQTPHPVGQDGTVPLPPEPADFDYSYLDEAVFAVARAAATSLRRLTVGVVSTVSPGTLRRRYLTDLTKSVAGCVDLAYCPVLISLGTVIPDLLNPPMTLIGTDDQAAVAPLTEVLHRMNGVNPTIMSIESAELLKLAWNALISTKIVFANTVAELCQALPPADVGDVTAGLRMLDWHDGGEHLRAGLGDGGPCRPRDAAALAHLARRLGVSHDPFTALTRAREVQAVRLAETVTGLAAGTGLPVRILGLAYRAGGRLTDGSPARLLDHYLMALGVVPEAYYDPVMGPNQWPPPANPAVYVIATPHREVVGHAYPPGSLVIDPWGLTPDREGVQVHRLGEATA